jgi:hypothetical protein
MNHIPVKPGQREVEECDSSSRVVSGVGMALFLFGIFIPGAHTLMMVGLALLSIAYLV